MLDEKLISADVKNLNKDDEKETELKKKTKKSKVSILKIFLFQTFVCFLVVGLILGLKFFDYSKYLAANEKFKTAFKGPKFEEFINITISNLKDFFGGDIKTNFKKDSEEYILKQEEKEIKNQTEKEDENFNIAVAFEDDLKNCDNLLNGEDDDVMFLTFKHPLKGRISSKYGSRENPISSGKKDFHHGVDIAVKDGTPVFAIADGVVKKTANSQRSGNFLSIKHGQEYESIYAHCSKILVPQGRNVKKGEKIALSGHTGNVTGAHLHLGIKKNGSWINPAEIFPEYL